MKHFIKAHILLCFGVCVLLLCLLAGTGTYIISNKILREAAEVKSLPWTMPLTATYHYLDFGQNPDEFTAVVYDEEDNDTEYTLDIHGTVLHKEASSNRVEAGTNAYRFYDKETSLYGLVDKKGNTILPAQFSALDFYGSGYGTGEKEGVSMILDTKGNILFKGEIGDEILHVTGALYFVNSHDNTIFDCETGESLPIDNRYHAVWPAAEGQYYAITENDNMVFLDDDFRPAGDGELYNKFGVRSQGLRYVEKLKDAYYSADSLPESPTLEKGYMDESGNMVITLPRNTLYGFRFSEDKAIVITSNALKCYNLQGKELFSLKGDFDNTDILSMETETPGEMCYTEGYAPVCLEDYGEGGKFGLIDKKGRFVIKPVFHELRHNSNGYLIAAYKDSYGILTVKEGF
ncbi:MAG: WG repeat-containing protein [Emergencia sp.]